MIQNKRKREDGEIEEEVKEEKEEGIALNEENEYRICEVNRFNFDSVYDFIVTACKGCSFFAVDTEFSGLDSGPAFKSKNIEERYSAFREMVMKYALLQFGLSFFKEAADGTWKSISFTFHVVQKEKYVVAPRSMIFLAEHGVSLTSVYKRGIQFSLYDEGCRLRALWKDLAAARKPLVMHNGIIDMMFLYNTFFKQMPLTSQDWVKG